MTSALYRGIRGACKTENVGRGSTIGSHFEKCPLSLFRWPTKSAALSLPSWEGPCTVKANRKSQPEAGDHCGG